MAGVESTVAGTLLSGSAFPRGAPMPNKMAFCYLSDGKGGKAHSALRDGHGPRCNHHSVKACSCKSAIFIKSAFGFELWQSPLNSSLA